MHSQHLFVVFEGVLMVVAAAVLGVFHPVLCLGVAIDNRRAKPMAEVGGLREDGDGEEEASGAINQIRHQDELAVQSLEIEENKTVGG